MSNLCTLFGYAKDTESPAPTTAPGSSSVDPNTISEPTPVFVNSDTTIEPISPSTAVDPAPVIDKGEAPPDHLTVARPLVNSVLCQSPTITVVIPSSGSPSV